MSPQLLWLDRRCSVRLDGPDAERFLQGTLTRDIPPLKPGAGLWAVSANNRGMVQGILRVRRVAPSAFVLDAERASAERAIGAMAALIVTDDCAFTDLTPQRDVLLVLGEGADAALADHGLPLPGPADSDSVEQDGLTAIRSLRLGRPAVELHGPKARLQALVDALLAEGAALLPQSDLQRLKAHARIPSVDTDLGQDTTVHEAGLVSLVDFDKGCYVGQEAVNRAQQRGGVRYGLVQLSLPAVPAELPQPLLHDGKQVGELGAALPDPEGAIALAVVRLEAAEPGTPLTAGPQPATVLPPTAPLRPPA